MFGFALTFHRLLLPAPFPSLLSLINFPLSADVLGV